MALALAMALAAALTFSRGAVLRADSLRADSLRAATPRNTHKHGCSVLSSAQNRQGSDWCVSLSRPLAAVRQGLSRAAVAGSGSDSVLCRCCVAALLSLPTADSPEYRPPRQNSVFSTMVAARFLSSSFFLTAYPWGVPRPAAAAGPVSGLWRRTRHCRTVSAMTSPDDVPRIDPALTDPSRWLHRMPVWLLTAFVVCAVALYGISALMYVQGSGPGRAGCALHAEKVVAVAADGEAASRRARGPDARRSDKAAEQRMARRTVYAIGWLSSTGCDKYADLSGLQGGCRELAVLADMDTGVCHART